MRKPAIHWAHTKFFEIAMSCSIELPDGRWVPARSEPFHSIMQRWRAAWLVFTGQADALIWIGQPK